MRKKFIAGNWKMNKNISEGLEFIKFLNGIKWKETVEVALFPSFLSVPGMVKESKEAFIGAQNCYFEKEGAFTGEVSIPMLEATKATHCIIGHSERREIFKETDDLISEKLEALLNSNLIPVLCVGETAQEREEGKAFEKIKNQLKILKNKTNSEKLIIAYEPIWAIGTGKTATSEDAEEMCRFIRENTFDDIRVLYGGSVKPSNAEELFSKENIDGALIGGASLKIDDFIEIIRQAEKNA